MHILQPIGAMTRQLHRLMPQRPIRGMARLGNFLQQSLPAYEGAVTMNAGFKMHLNSSQGAEMSLLLSGMYQPALTYVLSQVAVMGGYYLDVGANLGFYSLLFAHWAGKQGKVAAFEVNPQMVARIRSGNQINGFDIDLVEQAVHKTAGDNIAFYVSASPGKSSIYGEQVSDIAQEIRVKTTTIDTYIAAQGWPRVDVIKMDIEGNDCNGIIGAAQTIRQHRPFIVFEYWHNTPEQTKQEAMNLLAEAGYRLEILHLKGNRQPFNWQVPASRQHVDVLCFPKDRASGK